MQELYKIRKEAEDPPVIAKKERKSAIEVPAPPISRWKKFIYFIKSKFKR